MTVALSKIELKHVESEVSYLHKERRWECRILTQGEPSIRLVLTRRKADARLMGEIFVAQAYREMATKIANDNNAKCDMTEAMVSWRSAWPFHSSDTPPAEPPMYHAPATRSGEDLELEAEMKKASEWMVDLRIKKFKQDELNRGLQMERDIKIVQDPNYNPIGKGAELNDLYYRLQAETYVTNLFAEMRENASHA